MKKIAIIFLGGLLLFAGCKREKAQKETVRTVKVSTATTYGEKQKASFPGKVKASSEISVAFRTSGPIAKVNVKEGQYVRKGQVLAEMDSRDYAIQFAATEAEYRQVKAEAERIIQLYEKQSVPANDYDRAVSALKQITAKYDAHKNALEDTRLTAPFDGYVQKRYFDRNETLSAGMPVFSIISTESPEVVVNIPVTEYVRRDKFDSYTCYFDIYPDKVFPLELISISPKANLNQLYTVRLKLNTDEGALVPSPGMSTMVAISFKSESTGMVSVPLPAIFEIDGKPFVWLYDEKQQKVTARSVSLYKIQNDGTAIISEGLKEGEKVVSAGVRSLSDGETVKLLPEISPTNVGGLL
jgi:RND family efflux transporter MFP subunit